MDLISRAVVAVAIAATLSACAQRRTGMVIPQSGLVPAGRAPAWDGAPLDGRVRLEGHASTTLAAPSAGDDPSRGARVARHHAGGAIRIRAAESADVGLTFETAARTDATAAGDTSVAVPAGRPRGVGVAARGSVAATEGLDLGVAVAFAVWRIPVGSESRPDGSAHAPVLSVTLAPSHRRGRFVFFGGATVTSEIHIPAERVAGGSSSGPRAELGDFMIVLAAGATAELGGGARLTAHLGQPLGSQVGAVLHGAVSLAIDLGR